MNATTILIIIAVIVVCAIFGTALSNSPDDLDLVPVGSETEDGRTVHYSHKEDDGVFDVKENGVLHTTGAAVVRDGVVYSLTEEEYIRIMQGADVDAVLAERR